MKLLSILLTVLFIGLKLTNNIRWSWIWVLSPLWIWISGLLFLIFMAGLCSFIVELLKNEK
jgi:hypothetical protein